MVRRRAWAMGTPAKQRHSENALFVLHIPRDIRERLVGQTLTIPLDGLTKSIPITDKTRAIRFSLQASDSTTVKRRHAACQLFLEALFKRMREEKPTDLSDPNIAALLGELHASWARPYSDSPQVTVTPITGMKDEDHEEDPELIAEWKRVHAELAERAATDPATFFAQPEGGQRLEQLAQQQGRLKGIPTLTRRSLGQLAEGIPSAVSQGLTTAAKKRKGDYSPDAALSGYPAWQATQRPATGLAEGFASKVSLMGLVEDWWAEAKATGKSESTHESYRNSVKLLVKFLKHDDATRVTPQDIVAFKDYRLKTINPKTGKPVSAKTVKASDLTAFKSVFDWAVSNLKLPTNPASGVNVKLGKKVKVRERDFTADEIRALLIAADRVLAGTARAKNQTELAKRWVPWLCAYTGARVGELVQLRKEDLMQDQESGAWVLMVTPEAGTVKGKERRDIPIHEHLIALGFMEFVKAAPKGYLFMTIKPGSEFLGVWQSKKNRLAEFARETVTDPNVAPNHGWRHTFKSRGFEAGIQEKVLDAICGHAPRSVGQAYGTVTMKTKVDAIRAFPRYQV